jgi:hypothetical protein
MIGNNNNNNNVIIMMKAQTSEMVMILQILCGMNILVTSYRQKVESNYVIIIIYKRDTEFCFKNNDISISVASE